MVAACGIAGLIEKFQTEHRACKEFPTDAFYGLLLSLIVNRQFDNKKSAREICEFLLDRYRDVWMHGTAFLKNVSVVMSRWVSDDFQPSETQLLRIRNVIRENGVFPETVFRRVYLILEKIKRPGAALLESTELLMPECSAVAVTNPPKLGQYRVSFKNCWVEFLRCTSLNMSLLDKELLRKLLRTIPDTVMPHIGDPEIFASFFVNCFEQKSDVEIALLSITGLFQLISRHNLGEPDALYARLYELLTPSVMDDTNKTTLNRVFQMLTKALRSQYLPSRYIPVFVKKMIRIAVLVSSPSVSLWLVVTSFNLMQSNPIVSKYLVHNDKSGHLFKDPFSIECSDIDSALSTISQTSLWELELLMSHTDPSVVRMSKMFNTNFFAKNAKRVTDSDFLFITEEQLFNRERNFGSHKKKLRQDITAEATADSASAAIPIAMELNFRDSSLDSLFQDLLQTA